MRAYACRICGLRLFFENSWCVRCGSRLGYSRAERDIVPVDADGHYRDKDGRDWWICRNQQIAECTWLAGSPDTDCFSCRLTRTRPNDADLTGLAQFVEAERAKRHLITDLDSRGLPVISKHDDPQNGLAFDLLSSTDQPVIIGHQDGVITLDLAETRPEYREKVRVELTEPYRTVLGHFRHEVGHYYQWQLVRGDRLVARSRELFGDETAEYQAAVDRHYASGPPPGWQDAYISTYATMHPYEDFAETFAHLLHITDTVQTAAENGLIPAPDPDLGCRQLVVSVWIPLCIALNQINASMGKDDLYPFVIPPAVLDKLDFIAELPADADDRMGSGRE